MKEKMPEKAKLLLEMIRKAGENGVTREEMRNTASGDLFLNPNGCDWLESQKKIKCHAQVKGTDIVNTWFLYKEKKGGEELPDCLRQAPKIP